MYDFEKILDNIYKNLYCRLAHIKILIFVQYSHRRLYNDNYIDSNTILH